MNSRPQLSCWEAAFIACANMGIQYPVARFRNRGPQPSHCEEPFDKLRIESAMKQSHPPIEIAALSLAMTSGMPQSLQRGFQKRRALPSLS